MAHSANEIPVSHKQLQDDIPRVVRSNETELGIYQPGIGNMVQLKPEALIKSGEQTLKQVVNSAGEVVLETLKTAENVATSIEHLGLDLIRMSIRSNNFVSEELGRTLKGSALNTVKGTVEIASEIVTGVGSITRTGIKELNEVHQLNLSLTRDLVGSLFRGFSSLKSREKSSKKESTVIPITVQDS